MEYAELNLYNRQGGDAFTTKNIISDGGDQSLDENDKKILKAYKKKIIEQRNEIESLKKRLENNLKG